MKEENNQEIPDTSGVDVEATPSPATEETEAMPPLEEASDEAPGEDAAEEKEKMPRKKKIAIIAGCCAAAIAVFAISALVGYNLMHVGTVKATVNAENWNSETDTQAIVYVYEGDQAEVLGNDDKADDPDPVAEQFVTPNEETVLHRGKRLERGFLCRDRSCDRQGCRWQRSGLLPCIPGIR